MAPEFSRPEFSRPEKIDTIGERARDVTVEADAEERRRLAGRFGLVSIDRLTARFAVRRDAAGIAVDGRVEAQVVQSCSVTGDPIPARVDEPVRLLFVEPLADGEEIELSGEAIDTVELEGGAIDLGEAAAETMALALDPFPRSPAAAAVLAEAGVLSEDEAGPFSGLAALKGKLGK
jgi:uncharacterized metal-binding protein YceD (DUF177 family)